MFLNGPDVIKSIRGGLRVSSRARFAVAYWGSGAIERLGLRDLDAKAITVVCDARSGGCDPNELQKLSSLLGDNLRTLDRLHAKIWVFDNSAIVGSSNASSNGLGLEGRDAESLIEANLLTEDPNVVSDLTEWFDANVMARSRPVDSGIISQARRARRQRPPAARYEASLIEEARARSAAIHDRIYVWVHPHEGQDLDKEVARIANLRGIRNLEYWQDVGEEELAHPPGTYVIDFDCSGGGAPKYTGVYQILHEGHVVEFRDGRTSALLCVPARGRVYGQSLGDRREWRKAARMARLSEVTREVWALSEFAKYLQ